MKFTPLQITAFRDASHDLNPLHLDADYARRSQFGKPVVYGMAAVLFGLGKWANERYFRLKSLRAVFRKPLFEGEEYDLLIAEHDTEVSIKFRKGPVDYTVITFEWEPLHSPATENSQLYKPFDPNKESASKPFHPKKEAASEPLVTAHQEEYLMNTAAWPQLAAAFAIHPTSMPTHQLATLLWASYHVGMSLPGRQALFSEFQVDFDATDLHSAAITLDLKEADFDDRFNRFVLEGNGPAISSLRIAAFKRPLPVDFPLATMPAFAEGYLPLQGKVVFISGATRGFGAAMARMCARAGARLALNYRGDASSAIALCDELQAAGAQANAYPADMTDPRAVSEMVAAITQDFGGLDLIVNNAAPPIRDFLFLEQDNAHLQQFVQLNLAITLETARHLLPILRKGGQFLHISTKYLADPVRGFAHYLTAKAAQEALVQALSLESRDHAFLVVRLPRILTDQTNLAFDFDPPLHPGEVARDAIMAVANTDPSDHFRIVNLFE